MYNALIPFDMVQSIPPPAKHLKF